MSVFYVVGIEAPLPMAGVAAELPETTFRVDGWRVCADDAVVLRLTVHGPASDRLPDRLDAHDDVVTYTLLEDNEAVSYRVRVASVFDAAVYPFVHTELAALRVDADGLSVVGYADGRADIWEARDVCHNLGYDCDLGQLSPVDDAVGLDSLTELQAELLATAHELGYFDVPSRATTEDIAAALGLSKTAVSQRLRDVQRDLTEAVT